ncbi:sulfite exporter TauE/SafE family protein [Plantactinospora sp. WMMB782]|uniref:sulfite exporter TauE/SafE family protein n=1 Tax=Plantactinospora sp. WMMB782 TaxID=3404121 RepID=UPI003B955493
MDFPEALLLLAAGLAAGVVNAVAGGGSLITFPALIAIGLPPVPANVSNSMSVCPGYLASVWGSRADLPDRRWLLRLVPGTVLGTAAGCALLLSTPARAFELAVPFLVLGATAVLAFQDQLRRLVRVDGGQAGQNRPGLAGGRTAVRSVSRQALALHVMVVVGAVYGGYFGAALGVMLVAGLALVLDETLTRISAIKNLLSAVVGLTTIAAFAVFGPVNWAAVAVVAPATIIGGYAGARLVRRLAPEVLKTVIVVFGTAIGLLLLYRSWA